MEAQWQSLIARWQRENPTPARRDVDEIARYRALVRRRHLLWRLHWQLSKAATALTYGFALYWMLTTFSAGGLAIAVSLCAVATTATLVNDPRHLGLIRVADRDPADYLGQQRAVLDFALRSVRANLLVYALLAAVLLVLQPGQVPLMGDAGFPTRWVWPAMAASLLFDSLRWRRARAALRRLAAFAG